VIQIILTWSPKSKPLQLRKHLLACLSSFRVGECDEADAITFPGRMVAMPLLAVDQGDLPIELRRLHTLAFELPAQVVTNDEQERRPLVLVIIVPLRASVHVHVQRSPTEPDRCVLVRPTTESGIHLLHDS
jgi:hypothetical protein